MSSRKPEMSARLFAKVIRNVQLFLLTKTTNWFIIYVIKGEKNMAEIISGIYKITNTVTNDFYIGSSKNIEKRWAYHKCKHTWMQTAKLYQAFNKYGIKSFRLEIIEETTDLNNRKKNHLGKQK